MTEQGGEIASLIAGRVHRLTGATCVSTNFTFTGSGAFARSVADGRMKRDLRSSAKGAHLSAQFVWQGYPQALYRLDARLSRRKPCVMRGLHSEPHSRRCAERALESCGNIGG